MESGPLSVGWTRPNGKFQADAVPFFLTAVS